MPKFVISSNNPLSFDVLENAVGNKLKLQLSEDAKSSIVKCRKFLETKLKSMKSPVYGINTGFGSLCNTVISDKDLEKLQDNLVKSHACGTGDEVPVSLVRLMMLIKIHALSQGYSGIQLATVERMIELYNLEITPVVYTQGSLGASGDLAPLAHLSLPLIGEGEVFFKGKKYLAKEVLKKFKLKPLKFKAKEALALLNGTQFMSAYGAWLIIKAFKLSALADKIAAVSLDAFECRTDPFDESIQMVRPHAGQVYVSARIRNLLLNSKLALQPKKQVQDPYSFRCIPQVHGASVDAISYVASVILTEINSVTDNPTLFPDENKIISGGNFHGQPLALSLDFLAIALAELASISERRIYLLISGQRNLPPFLVAKPGLNSGLMIVQYTAASVVSENKQLCTPASVDSIVSSNGQEDHVSMGANAATKCKRVADNVERVLAMEMITASQALEFRNVNKTSPVLREFVYSFRNHVAFIKEDIIIYPEIEKAINFLKTIA